MDELKPPPMSDEQVAAVLLSFDRDADFDDIVLASVAARDAQWLSIVGELQRDAERLRTLYLAVQSDGYGWWTPDWCIKEGETAPTFDQFRSQIDTERAAIDAARGEKGDV